jgi:hypothetical protein
MALLSRARIVRSVSLNLGLADLALQHEDLVTERKNLSVAGVTGREYPADSSENEACERGNQGHKSSTLPISKETRNPQDHWADDFSARTGSARPSGQASGPWVATGQ